MVIKDAVELVVLSLLLLLPGCAHGNAWFRNTVHYPLAFRGGSTGYYSTSSSIAISNSYHRRQQLYFLDDDDDDGEAARQEEDTALAIVHQEGPQHFSNSYEELMSASLSEWHNSNDEDNKSYHSRYQQQMEHSREENAIRSESPSSISMHDVATSLLWTCDWNQRIRSAARDLAIEKIKNQHPIEQWTDWSLGNTDHLRGGGIGGRGGSMVSAGPYRVPAASSVDSSEADSAIDAIFHSHPAALSSRSEIEKFLHRLVDALASPASNRPRQDLELALTMIYMDRACSAETCRDESSCRPLPFCTPRTVRRLVATAHLVATAAVRGIHRAGMTEHYVAVQTALGIPVEDCDAMVAWMQAALGGERGLFVTPEELHDFKALWDMRFPAE